MAEHDAAAVGDSVYGPLAAFGELHDQELGSAHFRKEIRHLLELHGEVAGPLVDELVRPVDLGIEDPEASRARAHRGLEADGAARVAELVSRGRERRSSAHLPEDRDRDAELRQPRVTLGFVIRRPHGLGAADEDGDASSLEIALAVGKTLEVVRRLGQDYIRALTPAQIEHGSRETVAASRWDSLEGIAEKPADDAFVHVATDEPDLSIAVLAQGAEKSRGSRCACRGHEDSECSHRG